MSKADPNLMNALGQQRVVSLGDGRAAIEFLAGMHMCHSGGVVQGGFITGWIDAAMAHAVMDATGGEMTPMSLELKVSFFAPTRPGLAIAEAWIVQSGRSTCFVEGHLLDPEGKLLAKASSTIRLIPRAKVEAQTKAALS